MEFGNPVKGLVLLLIVLSPAQTLFSGALEDRTAVERVYHEHRTGTSLSFEEAIPESLIRQLVEKNQKKEYLLKTVYDITITNIQIQAEVDRINKSTRAPQMLAEIKAALGNDPQRFAKAVAKPLVVERILRNKFINDNDLHSAARKTAELIRNQLLGAVAQDVQKQLTIVAESGLPVKVVKWSMDGSSDRPAPPSVKGGSASNRYSFNDLHPKLQTVLDLQLQNPGDVSAVVEFPTGFQVFLLINRTAIEMEVNVLTIQKQGYDAWLSKQEYLYLKS